MPSGMVGRTVVGRRTQRACTRRKHSLLLRSTLSCPMVRQGNLRTTTRQSARQPQLTTTTQAAHRLPLRPMSPQSVLQETLGQSGIPITADGFHVQEILQPPTRPAARAPQTRVMSPSLRPGMDRPCTGCLQPLRGPLSVALPAGSLCTVSARWACSWSPTAATASRSCGPQRRRSGWLQLRGAWGSPPPVGAKSSALWSAPPQPPAPPPH